MSFLRRSKTTDDVAETPMSPATAFLMAEDATESREDYQPRHAKPGGVPDESDALTGLVALAARG